MVQQCKFLILNHRDSSASAKTMSSPSFILLLGLVIVSFGLIRAQRKANDCRTPDRGTGNCVPVKDCRAMTDLLKNIKRPVSPAVNKRIQAYLCGTSNGSVKVCCPPGPINLNTNTKTTIPFHDRVDPPDVTRHRNLNLLPTTCGYLDTQPRIVNGNDSALNEFPWMALLQYKLLKDNKLKFLCGGTVINKNYILTAAHCLTEMIDPPAKLVSVRVGEHSIKNKTDCAWQANKKVSCNPPVQDLAVREIVIHPQYGGRSTQFYNDIGLIRVARINLNVVNVSPICLPIGVVRDYPFRRVIVTGWGTTNPSTGETADILQKVGLPVADKATCLKIYNRYEFPLANTQICAGGADEKDACNGDSGGPMLAPTPIGQDATLIYVQQGIVSIGPEICAKGEYPVIYTVVKFYMDWILDNMKS